MSRPDRSGFTLIELLVVIAIIAILAAILFPVFARARMKAHAATCTSNLKQIAMSIRMYCDDHEGAGPYNECNAFWQDRLYVAGYGPKRAAPLYTCKGGNGSYALNPYRGGHCANGYPNQAPWDIDNGPFGKVKQPEAVMLVADGRGQIPTTANGPAYFYDIAGDGQLTPAHLAVNNVAFVDGHVKGLTPTWMKDEVDHADPATGRGVWFWWMY